VGWQLGTFDGCDEGWVGLDEGWLVGKDDG
jgi:hypothetical protein